MYSIYFPFAVSVQIGVKRAGGGLSIAILFIFLIIHRTVESRSTSPRGKRILFAINFTIRLWLLKNYFSAFLCCPRPRSPPTQIILLLNFNFSFFFVAASRN